MSNRSVRNAFLLTPIANTSLVLAAATNKRYCQVFCSSGILRLLKTRSVGCALTRARAISVPEGRLYSYTEASAQLEAKNACPSG